MIIVKHEVKITPDAIYPGFRMTYTISSVKSPNKGTYEFVKIVMICHESVGRPQVQDSLRANI